MDAASRSRDDRLLPDGALLEGTEDGDGIGAAEDEDLAQFMDALDEMDETIDSDDIGEPEGEI